MCMLSFSLSLSGVTICQRNQHFLSFLFFLINVVGLYFITNEIVETEKVGVAKSHEECPTVPVFNL